MRNILGIVLSVVNQKGGVGKTTSSISIATALAKAGRKTLLIDLDPQGNATSGFGFAKHELEATAYDVLVNDLPLAECIIDSGRKNLSICPANIDLTGAEIELVSYKQREKVLGNALRAERDNYDFILIDCPPSLGLLTLNALTAADGVVVPVQAEYYALEGLTQLINTIDLVQRSTNPNLAVFGVFCTMVDTRTQLAQQVMSEVKSYFAEKTFETFIPRNVRLSEAPSYGKAVQEYDKWSKGARSYDALAKEFMARVNTDWKR